jgi:hypothetical protein
MNKLIALLLGLTIWYLVFYLLTTQFNPMEWNIWIKLIAVLIAFKVLHNVAEYDRNNSMF